MHTTDSFVVQEALANEDAMMQELQATVLNESSSSPNEEMLKEVEQLDSMINANASAEAQAVLNASTGSVSKVTLLQRMPSNKSMRTLLSLFDPKTEPDLDATAEATATATATVVSSSSSAPRNVRKIYPDPLTMHDPPVSSASSSQHSPTHVTPASVMNKATSISPPGRRRSSVDAQSSSTNKQHTANDAVRQPSMTNGSPPANSRVPPLMRRKSSLRNTNDTTTTPRRRSSASSFAESVTNFTSTITKIFENLQNDIMDEKKKQRVAELVDKEVLVLNADQLAHIQKRNAHPFTISVHSNFRHWWDFVLAISVIYVLVTTPVKLGFDVNPAGVGYVIDVMVDLIYLVEVTLNFFTSYVDDATGEEIKDLKLIRHNYLYGWFVVDAVSSFPSSLVGNGNELLTLTKILKVARVVKLSDSGLFKAISQRINRTMNPSVMRMIELTLIFFVSQHFIACMYYFISAHQAELTTWGPAEEIRESTLIRKYVDAFYFAIMVTTANDVQPTNPTEKLVTSVMLFIGIVINASIIGSAANLLANLDKAEIARKNQMDSINDYLRFKKVPLGLQNQIRRYYEYALTSRIVDPTVTLFADLPDRLKLALKLNLHDEFIRKVPLFKVCSSAGVIAIIQCLQTVVVMPFEIIISQGEVGNEFYFIKSGRVSLCVHLGSEVIPLGNLGEGSFFGETSLLTGEPQKAEVKAESIAELAYLMKDDFMAIIDRFPTFFLAVKRISDSRMQTAANVQKMKMGRDKKAGNGQSTRDRISLKTAATAVLLNTKRPTIGSGFGAADKPDHSIGKKSSESRSTFVSMTAGPAMRLAKRAPSRKAQAPMFNVRYVEGLSLAQARHLATIRAIHDMEIDASDDWDGEE